WSRFSGGSGAPYWTLPACGIDPSNITATQASIIHSEYPLPTTPAPSTLPSMIWSTNYGRLLCQTLFTLFFAGSHFAPHCIIDNINIQEWLQSHYINAFAELAKRIAEFDGGALLDDTVIGWDSLNEPYEGLVGWLDLNRNPTKQGSTLKKGTYPTPAQSMRLGMGQAQTVEHWSFGAMGPTRDGSVTIDPKGRKLWVEADDDPESIRRGEGEGSDGVHRRWGWKRDVSRWKLGICPWAMHGVWDVQTGYVLEPSYFVTRPGTTDEVEFIADYWKAHFVAYTRAIRRYHKRAIVFVQPPVFARPPDISEEVLEGRAVYAPHYYDGFTLITKHWNWFNADALGMLRGKYGNVLQSVKVGETAIRKSLREQLGYLKADALILSGEGEGGEGGQERYPTVIGEIGTPFDMDNKKAYGYGNPKYKGDYSSQEKALDASLNAADGSNGLSWTVWTYVGVLGDGDDGAHTHEWGDGWNGEDLSLWSGDDLYVDEWGEWEGGLGGDINEERSGEEGERREGSVESGGSEEGVKRYGQRETAEAGDSRDGLVADSDAEVKVVGRTRKPLSRQPSAKSLMRLAGGGRGGRRSRMASEVSLMTLHGGSVKSKGSVGDIKVKAGGVVNANANAKVLTNTIPTNTNPNTNTTTNLTLTSSYTGYKPTTPERLAGYHPNPLLFLTNGARAFRAFVRPYPMRVVGRVKGIEFDVGRGRVRVVVGVREGDAIANGEREDCATEIFVPLVHFAHPRLLEGLFDKKANGNGSAVSIGGGSDRWNTSTSRAPSTLDAGSRTAIGMGSTTAIGMGSTTALDTSPRGSVGSASTSSTAGSLRKRRSGVVEGVAGVDNDADADAVGAGVGVDNGGDGEGVGEEVEGGVRSGAPDPVDDYDGELVDLDVWVSEGRWDVKGQVLRWWYPVPGSSEGGSVKSSGGMSSGKSGKSTSSVKSGKAGKGGDDGEKEYVIEIKRKGGALKGL
ncbi:hypothetical protein CVT24_007033, partial [Panaeolus cyanescens]